MEKEYKLGRVGIRRKLRRRRHKLLAIALLEDFAKNTSLHGLRYITERGLSLIEKLFWIITFLISLSLCLFLIRNVWLKWQSSPVIVALSEHLVSVGEVPFPSVMICPQIKAKRTKYNFTDETLTIIKRRENITSELEFIYLLKDDPSVNKYEDISLICEIDDDYESVVPEPRTYSNAEAIKNINEVSLNIEDIFNNCRWRQQYVNCRRLFQRVLTKEGICFTMNTLAAEEIFRENSTQNDYSYLETSTRSHGWSYTKGYTNTDSGEYPLRGKGNGGAPDVELVLQEQLVERDGLCNGYNRGYKIYLQHPADMPQASLYYYAALPHQTSSLALKFSILNTSSSLRDYSPETRQCYFPEERRLKYFLTYTPNNCRLECLSNYTFEECDCVWFHMPHDDSSTICRQAKKDCVMKALERFATDEGLPDTAVSKCSCLPSCVGIQYDAEILKTNLDTKSYFTAIKNVFPNIITDQVKRLMDEKNVNATPFYGESWFRFGSKADSRFILLRMPMTFHFPLYVAFHFQFTKIEVYYKEPRFVSMRRSELFGLTDFLANCGGLLGLFLGFSFLSIVEIVYFCTLRLGFTLQRDKKNERAEIYNHEN